MLESIGLGEAADQLDADVIVFNTCTIREKPDQRFAAHLAQAAALKQRDPEKVIAVGGCYAEAQRDRLFELYPYVDVAFGPGSIPHLADWIGAGGIAPRGRFGEWDVVRGRPARPPRAPLPGLGADLDGLQLDLLVLHRPGGARPRAEPPARRDRRGGDEARRRRREGADAARPERELVGPGSAPRSRHGLRRAAARVRRGGGHRADPLHEPASQGLPAPRDRGDGRVRVGVRARAPAAPVGLDEDPQGDAAHLRGRAVPSPRGGAAGRHPRPRAHDRPDRRLPRRDRGRLPRRRSPSSRRSASTARSPSSTRRARAPTRPRCPTRCRRRSSASGSSG